MSEMMENILIESETIAAIENNHYNFLVDMAHLSRRKMHLDRSITWINCMPALWPRGIFRAKFTEANADAEIKRVIAEIECGNAPNYWLTGPTFGPKDLESRLEAHGFQLKQSAAAMAAVLSDCNLTAPSIQDFALHTVEDKAMLRDWVRVIVLGTLNLTEEAVEEIYKVFEAVLSFNKLKLFMGFYKGQPVSSSALYCSNGVAGIYLVATLPEHRRKGFGAAVTAAPLIHARDACYKVATLFASEMGESIYKKIGFKEFCKLGRYQRK